MLCVEIPIWFYWGSCKGRPPQASFKCVDSLCPTPDKVSALLCLMLHPPTLLACHRNLSPSPISQHINPRVDKSQERHGSSSSTDKLLDLPKRSHAKPLKTRGDDLIGNALQRIQCEGYHFQATKYLSGWMNKGFEFKHGSTGVKWNPGGIIIQKVSDGSTVSTKNGTCAVNSIRNWNNQRIP